MNLSSLTLEDATVGLTYREEVFLVHKNGTRAVNTDVNTVHLLTLHFGSEKRREEFEANRGEEKEKRGGEEEEKKRDV